MYMAGADHMAPKFMSADDSSNLKDEDDQEGEDQKHSAGGVDCDGDNSFRRTQQNFHQALEQDSTNEAVIKTRGETPQCVSPRLKGYVIVDSATTVQQSKDHLQQIAEPKERRPYYQMHGRPPRTFRNAASSFASDQRSSQPDSISQILALSSINNRVMSNEDLADVSIDNKGKGGKSRTRNASKNQRQTWNMSIPKRKKPHMTNLAAAYSKGVESLIQTLPFQVMSRMNPIQTGSFRPGQPINTSMMATGMTTMDALHQSQSSLQSLPQSSTRSFQLKLQQHHPPFQIHQKKVKLLTRDVSSNNGQLTASHRSLAGMALPLTNVKSSVFQPHHPNTSSRIIDRADNDFTRNNKLITEYLSQNNFSYVPTTAANESAATSPRQYKSPRSPMKGQNIIEQNKLHKQPITNTERNIQDILERADYHKVRRHREIDCVNSSEGGTCTCPNHTQAGDNLSKSHNNSNILRGTATFYSPSHTKKSSNQIEKLQPIQLRPLKGKAALMQEYKTKIQEEYGKEKKKQMFETMYSPLARGSVDQSQQLTNIQLNLRQEQQSATMSPCRPHNQVRLRKIAPGGQYVNDSIIELTDEHSAGQMNVTMASIGSHMSSRQKLKKQANNSIVQQTKNDQRDSLDRKLDTTSRQFYLMSPNNHMAMQMSQRYNEAVMDQESMNADIPNLQVLIRSERLMNKTQQYMGLSELRNTNAGIKNHLQVNKLGLYPEEVLHNESLNELSLQHLIPMEVNGQYNINEESLCISPAKIIAKSPMQKNVMFQLGGNAPAQNNSYNRAMGNFKLKKSPQTLILQTPTKEMSNNMLMKLNESSATNVTPLQSDISTSLLHLPIQLPCSSLKTVMSDTVGYRNSSEVSAAELYFSSQNNGFEEQIQRQRHQIAKKMQEAIEAEAFLGPLERKPVQKKEAKSRIPEQKHLTKISVIDEFYNSCIVDPPLRPSYGNITTSTSYVKK